MQFIKMRLIRLPLEDIYLSNQLVMCKKFLRKFEPAFRVIAKKIEPQVKKWFSYKKTQRVFNGRIKYHNLLN